MKPDEPNTVIQTDDLAPLLAPAAKPTPPTAPGRWWQQTPLAKLRHMSPDLLAIALVYFVQGILKLAGLAWTFYQKDALQLEPAQMSIVDTLAMVPWTIKPLYGLVSDNFPIWGRKRRPYLLAAGLAGCLGWVGLAGLPPAVVPAVGLYCICRASTAFADVVADSLVVERTREGPSDLDGALQSLCWGCHASGRVLTAYLSGWLLDKIKAKGVFAATATFPLLICIAALLIKEQPVSSSRRSYYDDLADSAATSALPSKKVKLSHPSGSNSSKTTTNSSSSSCGGVRVCGRRLLRSWWTVWAGLVALWLAFKNPMILRPSIFLFMWQGTPSSGTAMFYFKTNQLKFSPEFLGRAHLVAAIADLLGILLYNTCLRKVGLRKLLLWGTLLGALVSLTPLVLVTRANLTWGISDRAFALADTALLNSISQVLMMPTLVLSARICPEGVEATLFASLMSLLNAASATSDLLGGVLTHALGVTKNNFDHLALLLVLCVTLGLLPLLFIHWVPSEVSGAAAAESTASSNGVNRPLQPGAREEELGLLSEDRGDIEHGVQEQEVELVEHLPQLAAMVTATAMEQSPRQRTTGGVQVKGMQSRLGR